MVTAFVYSLDPALLKIKATGQSPFAAIGRDGGTDKIVYFTNKDILRGATLGQIEKRLEVKRPPLICFGPVEKLLVLLMTEDGQLTVDGRAYSKLGSAQPLQKLSIKEYRKLTTSPIRVTDDNRWFYNLPQFKKFIPDATTNEASGPQGPQNG